MILLDTCAIIWDALDPNRLSQKAKKAINGADKQNALIIADISIWEISMLLRKKRLADALDVSSDYLLDGSAEKAAKANFEDRKLLRQFQEVEHLPEEDKTVVKKLLDAFLTKKQLQSLAH